MANREADAFEAFIWNFETFELELRADSLNAKLGTSRHHECSIGADVLSRVLGRLPSSE